MPMPTGCWLPGNSCPNEPFIRLQCLPVQVKKAATLYATVVLMMAGYLWFDTYAGQPRSGRILGAMVLFYGSCLWADHINRTPHAADLIRLACCVVLTVLLLVMSA